jgi:hypothetical protein
MAIPKGTKITCHSCGHEIAILKKDIVPYKRLSVDHFEWLNEQYTGSMAMQCRRCTNAFLLAQNFFSVRLDI